MKSGFNGEHSCLDGTPTSRLNDWLLRSLHLSKLPLGTTHRSLPPPIELSWSLSPTSQSHLSQSIKDFEEIMGKHSLTTLQFEDYGKKDIKAWRVGPDSWAQMCMQLGYWIYSDGGVAGTYESCQTRKFKVNSFRCDPVLPNF